MTSYTTRFQAYAKSKGLEPEHCKAGHEFISWIRAKVREWRAITGHTGHLLANHHQQIDKWLMELATEGAQP